MLCQVYKALKWLGMVVFLIIQGMHDMRPKYFAGCIARLEGITICWRYDKLSARMPGIARGAYAERGYYPA